MSARVTFDTKAEKFAGEVDAAMMVALKGGEAFVFMHGEVLQLATLAVSYEQELIHNFPGIGKLIHEIRTNHPPRTRERRKGQEKNDSRP